MKLENKVIVITGASDGIGKQIALKLAEQNSKLALIARNEKRLRAVKRKAENISENDVEIYVCDVGNAEKLEETVKNIVADFKMIDILINNAGVWQKMMPIEEVDEGVIDEVIRINLIGLINMTRLLMPTLKKQKEAAIINISSKSGVAAQVGQSVYSASKYGVRGFTDVLKEDLKGSNIRVAGVYQSGTNTKMFEKTGEDFETDKFTNPKDLADVIVYMLSRPEKIWLHDVRVRY